MKLVWNLPLAGLGMLFSLHTFATTTLIEQVRVFDGEKNLGVRNVLIVDDKIRSVDFHGKTPDGTQRISGRGKTLLPGLIDAHVHAFQDQDLPLLFGVTTEIDLFAAQPALQAWNQSLKEGGNHQQADIYSAGMLATAPGGHGTEYGVPLETLTRADQAQAWVDARIAEGSHFIKIIMEGGSAKQPINTLSYDIVRALIDAAHRRGKLAVAHISTYRDAQFALDAGADGLAHLFEGSSLSDDDMQKLVNSAKSHHAFVTPTFTVLESIAGLRSQELLDQPALNGLLSAPQLQMLKQTYGKTARPELMLAPKKMTAALQKAGVPLLAGTDAGNSGTQYGISMHREVRALTEAGLTPAEALKAATSAPARAYALPDRGRIAKGYLADLLLVEGEPDLHISDIDRISEVWKRGVAVSPQRQQRVQEIAKENSQRAKPVELPTDGRISLFSKEKLAAPFGFGWYPSSDAFLKGQSSIRHQISGELNGQAVLSVDASVKPGFAFPWAGIAFAPGASMQEAADLSNANSLSFKVRGDGKQYVLAIMMQGSFIPVVAPFTAEPDWKEVRLPFSQFRGLDPAVITSIALQAGPVPGDYHFEFTDVRLLKQ